MTKRMVSLMGVAAVATMVILAGCGGGPGAKPADEEPAEDHAAALAGTWMATVNRMVPSVPTNPMSPSIEVNTAVTAMIEAGETANTGTLVLGIVDTVVATMMRAAGISVNGTIEVDASEIMVMVMGVDPPEAATANPAVAQILATPQSLNYSLSEDGNMLTVSSALLPVLLGPMHTSLDFIKQMAGS